MSAREEGKLYFQKGKFSAAADAYTEAIVSTQPRKRDMSSCTM